MEFNHVLDFPGQSEIYCHVLEPQHFDHNFLAENPPEIIVLNWTVGKGKLVFRYILMFNVKFLSLLGTYKTLHEHMLFQNLLNHFIRKDNKLSFKLFLKTVNSLLPYMSSTFFLNPIHNVF